MQLIRNHHIILRASVVAIGNCDGMHQGHQQLIQTAVSTAHEQNISSILITFEPYASEFFLAIPPARLMRFREKWDFVKTQGVDFIYCLRFAKTLADMSAEKFVKNILVDQLHMKKIVIGDDFRFGANRLGDVPLLKLLGKQFDFRVETIPQHNYQFERISSTCVRNALKKGEFDTVRALLGRAFTLSGKVAYGEQMGRQLGFPTANIYLNRKVVPLMGIFIVRVHGLDGRVLRGVASIGYRPTFGGKQILLEVFILDFDEIIYGRYMTIEFLAKIRDELKFDSVDALVTCIQQDVRTARDYFTA